ncbi:Asp-tRNA(Asn)/Glu-tRNA(Gln) amidotransferase subunit GatA [methanotrophic endosymbiont of Bathymodiolus puteoserpentis (Logatchev)]|jgi:aspartyl-tRNA(Asn)/glutamyl-tRNA(Gln) amidotransferase subunit A|uniref:Asp-tRNA(Asn)/Glu-tRNA(Gln) amidotransferase subunit GatA n=1 Tax=methanotrophic endosymbiont of Bathymodiolus puteoserpentis (Logatchev) TaxID=343235 RepID=UPI0013C9BF1B|nr:Asp-tRNA(Asn)/Glu-tRNA(Gln) amidotransferase subunit GatA [methanotrophic endosymbiont of Bathymodiolus puteoserpentis (Logatchev)]SHE22765.1 Aspartyl-tRNA(Asn) amidotransferase subunit A @ Glutamyl-tRNA(Gln) amidotransferase subunit A [methanotrophic endosymbiont of Bathymodiolus puteoserpentis (Logatchev)]
MHTKTLAQIAQGLRAGDYSSQELTESYLARIKQHQDLNSFITVTEHQAIAAAKQADAMLAAGDAPFLTGVPMAHKDIFCTLGVKTSCGSKMLDNFISPYNATVVEKFNAAGAVSLGKLNMDEFAMGSSNETSFYGTVKNPWATHCVPGGSSGGSAAAVAARLIPGATGTDTGGSIRQPAALCGITGLKPTYGRVSRYGMIAYASSLDQGGPMAQTAEDTALMLQVMAGFDSQDSTSVDCAVPDYSADLNNSLTGLKIGLPKEFFDEALNSEMAASIDTAINEYRKMGAEIVEVSMPNLKLAIPSYYVIAPAECSANLSRLDGVRYGYRCENPTDLNDLYIRSRGEAFGTEVKRRILVGTYALSEGYYDAYYIKAQKIRRLISDDFKQALEQVDVIMGPVSPTPAFGIGEKTDDPIEMYLADIYTIAINLAGLPAMSVPAGFIDNKPVGLQIIGNYFDEAKLLNVAHQYQQVTDWHQQTPKGFE